MIGAASVLLSFCALLAITMSAKSSTNNRETVDADFDFAVTGPGVIAGVGTGDTTSPEPYQATQPSPDLTGSKATRPAFAVGAAHVEIDQWTCDVLAKGTE